MSDTRLQSSSFIFLFPGSLLTQFNPCKDLFNVHKELLVPTKICLTKLSSSFYWNLPLKGYPSYGFLSRRQTSFPDTVWSNQHFGLSCLKQVRCWASGKWSKLVKVCLFLKQLSHAARTAISQSTAFEHQLSATTSAHSCWSVMSHVFQVPLTSWLGIPRPDVPFIKPDMVSLICIMYVIATKYHNANCSKANHMQLAVCPVCINKCF